MLLQDRRLRAGRHLPRLDAQSAGITALDGAQCHIAGRAFAPHRDRTEADDGGRRRGGRRCGRWFGLSEAARRHIQVLGPDQELVGARRLDARLGMTELRELVTQVGLAHGVRELDEHAGARGELDARLQRRRDREQDHRHHGGQTAAQEEPFPNRDQVDRLHPSPPAGDGSPIGRKSAPSHSGCLEIDVPINSLISVRVTKIAENIDTSTPTASVSAKP